MFRRFAVIAISTVIILACGSGGQSGSRPAPSPVTAPEASTLAVTARDYEFDAQDTIAAGRTLINLRNEGPKVHHVQLWKLEDSETFEAYKKALDLKSHDATTKPIVAFAGGVGSVGPGESAQAIVDLAPGNYVFVCRVLSPTLHLYRGMVAPLTVTASTATGSSDWVPQPDATVSFANTGFTLPADTKPGHHVWEFKNEGPGPRALEVTSKAGDLYGGSELIDEGKTQLVVLDLGPGDYVATSTWVAPDPTSTNFTVK
jgi:hypothetical protein